LALHPESITVYSKVVIIHFVLCVLPEEREEIFIIFEKLLTLAPRPFFLRFKARHQQNNASYMGCAAQVA
jgi:hypothetical protein